MKLVFLDLTQFGDEPKKATQPFKIAYENPARFT